MPSDPWKNSLPSEIGKLPFDVICHITSLAGHGMGVNCAAVSKKWRDVVHRKIQRAVTVPMKRRRVDECRRHAEKIYKGTKSKRGLNEYQVKKLQTAASVFFKRSLSNV